MDANNYDQCTLNFIIKPANKIRFRYNTEKGSHGVLSGSLDSKSKGSKKNFPTVKLENYDGEMPVAIKVSLYTEDETEEHVLKLLSKKNCENGICIKRLGNDLTAVFQLSIENKKKEEVYNILMKRKLDSVKDAPRSTAARNKLEEKYSKEIENAAKCINLNAAKLCFEAVIDGTNNPICRIFSETIYNSKSTETGDLKICRVSRITGSCNGGDEIFLFCNKVKKENIEVLFYELDDSENVLWNGSGKFTVGDWWHQVALVFKTPAYKANVKKSVWFKLYRSTDGACSEPRKFTYAPDDEGIKRKKPNQKDQSSCYSGFDVKQQTWTLSQSQMQSSVPDLLSDESCTNALFDYKSTWQDLKTEDLFSLIYNEGIFDGEKTNAANVEDEIENVAASNLNCFGEMAESNYFKNIGFEEHDVNAYVLPESNEMLVETDAIVPNCSSVKMPMPSSLGVKKVNLVKSGLKNFNSVDEDYEILKHVLKNALAHHDKKTVLKYACNCMPIQNKKNNTMLHAAIMLQGHNENIIDMVLQCLDNTVLNLENQNGQTPIHLAVVHSSTTVFKQLLQLGCSPNIQDKNGNNCFHLACENNKGNILIELLKFEKNKEIISQQNYEDLTPLHLAVMHESKECINLLISAGADLNLQESKCGKTALHLAIETNQKIALNLLSQDSIMVNIEDYCGRSPLDYALERNLTDIIDCLNSKGAQSNPNDPEDSQDSSEEEQDCNEFKECSSSFESRASVTYLTCEQEKRLCEFMNPQNLWKNLGVYLLDADKLETISRLESGNGTKAILRHIENCKLDNPLDYLKKLLGMANLQDALSVLLTTEAK